MEKSNRVLGIIIAIVIIMLSSTVYAYSGKLDENSNITISDELVEGEGTIEITRDIKDYKLSYQWVEIEKDLYNQIRKLKYELKMIECFNIYCETNDEEYYNYYLEMEEKYKNAFGEYLEDLTDRKVDENFEQIARLLPDYTNEWNEATNNKYRIDLSSFSGIKNYVVWVQLEKQDGTKAYDAEIFQLTGTKQETTNPPDKDHTQKPENPDKDHAQKPENSDNQNKPNESNLDDNKQDNSKPSNQNKLENTTGKQDANKKIAAKEDKTTSQKILPKTGIVNISTMIGLMASGVFAVMSFVKYRRIK